MLCNDLQATRRTNLYPVEVERGKKVEYRVPVAGIGTVGKLVEENAVDNLAVSPIQ